MHMFRLKVKPPKESFLEGICFAGNRLGRLSSKQTTTVLVEELFFAVAVPERLNSRKGTGCYIGRKSLETQEGQKVGGMGLPK